MTTETMLNDAYALARSRRMASEEDIALLATVMNTFGPKPTVVQLGAGSGTMSLAIFGVRPEALLVTVDNNSENLHWANQALTNSTGNYSILNHLAIHKDSQRAGREYMVRDVDLLIIDADHSYEGVKGDIVAWMPVMVEGGLIFVHDYDGSEAPEQYPGVKEACDEVLGRRYRYKRGWSAVFNARYVKAFADQLNK